MRWIELPKIGLEKRAGNRPCQARYNVVGSLDLFSKANRKPLMSYRQGSLVSQSVCCVFCREWSGGSIGVGSSIRKLF